MTRPRVRPAQTSGQTESSRSDSSRTDASSINEVRALASRTAAASILRNVTERRLALDEAVTLALRSHGALEDRDRALARAIAFVALKHLDSLRFVLDRLLKRPLAELPPDAAAALVVSAAQILFMAVPAHAAVDAAVKLVRRSTKSDALAGVANAVLRRVVDEKPVWLAKADPLRNLPDWLGARWRKAYGAARAKTMAAAVALEPALDITLLRAHADGTDWATRLGGVALPTGGIRLDTQAAIHTLPGYQEGDWIVQDAAAALPARLLAVQPGETVYDLCAAPGGKTAQLAAARANVTALDRSAPRLARLKDNMDRLGLTVTIVTADASRWQAAPADAVLLDAPCSGTGTIRRHPDIAWTKSPADLDSLIALQTRLLDNAAALVKPGGRLVYSTCSLEPEEGEAQIEAFLARHEHYRRDPVTAADCPGLAAAIDPHGALRTTPEMWPDANPRRAGLDGFYAARLRRHA
ncbi:MAG: 16S rRNA (cytosine(967)-C(5))-methyltransferase RsmB [Beijerinckiaceae bacterium]